MEDYYWPGNVRELRNVIERVYVETQNTVIGRNAFNEWVRERDYLSAGEWNVERLDDQKAFNKVISSPEGAASSLTRRITSPEIFEPQPAVTSPEKLLRSDSISSPVYPANRSSVASSSALDAEYRVSKSKIRKPDNITPASLGEAYHRANGNITQAANLLGIHKATFYRKMKVFGVTRREFNQPSEIKIEMEESDEPGD